MSNFFRKLRNEWRNMLDVLSNPNDPYSSF